MRRDVYEAVRELLVKAGYAALRLDDVADLAGVHKSTLYRQWATKAQLVRDVLNASQVAHYPRPDEGSWPADVDALCSELVRLFRQPDDDRLHPDPGRCRRPGAHRGAA